MKRLIPVLIVILIITTMTLACARAPSTATIAPAPYPVPAPAPAPRPATVVPGQDFAGGIASPSTSEERRIVRNGSLSLVVKDVLDVRDRVAQIAQGIGGYVLSSSISGQEENLRGNISVRVPDNKFEEALSQFRALAVRVRSENTSSQDVTQEYIDLQARLKNAQATEAQYLALLNRATTVEETLKIYQSLSSIRSEIEQLKGRIQYLEQVTSMSLINVNLEPESSARQLAPVGWNALEVLKSAVRGLVTLGQWLGNLIIWLIIFIPLWAIIGGIWYWVVRRRRKAKTP